jgi:UDP-N-acetylmuramoyl-tripeptide--D-alanyl-D-alanine ligase
MIPLSLDEVARVVNGHLADAPDPTVRVTGEVELDSRKVGPGGLFVALAGERTDGHDHAAEAAAAGAVGVLAARPVGMPAVVVPDVAEALGRLAAAVLARLPAITVVGITGSSGKTSTKDVLAQLLARLGPTVAPPGSFNNELGHPYTVLRATEQTRYLVLEKSARGIGHITALTRIARPRIGVVLNVGTAHLGEFGSREAIAKSKGELVEALPPASEGGVAVLNADDPLVIGMAARTAARVIFFGETRRAEAGGIVGETRRAEAGGTVGVAPTPAVRAAELTLDPLGRPRFRLVTASGEADVRLPLHGAHHVPNALAAAAVALELGLPLAEVVAGLSEVRPVSRWRMEVTERVDGVVVVNDAYNANPESMRAALSALAAMAAGRRSWAVLGQMAELGAAAGPEHRAIGAEAARQGVDRLVVVGAEAAEVAAGAAGHAGWIGSAVRVPDAAAAVELVTGDLRAGDIVLVKASRAAGLERVALALTSEREGAQGERAAPSEREGAQGERAAPSERESAQGEGGPGEGP